MPGHFSRRSFLIASAAASALRAGGIASMKSLALPQGGLQPQAVVDSEGVIHLVYLQGDPGAADIGYVRKGLHDKFFSTPLRVNSQSGSAVALGTVRGAHLALGKANSVHVAWNGSTSAQPKGPQNSAPMLYTRLNAQQNRFEPQRSVMTLAGGLDGGGALAADTLGNVYVSWHACGQQNGASIEGEAHRRVWLAKSTDNGAHFRPEVPVSPGELGACGCCGMGALANKEGQLYLLFRTAREVIHRDQYLLVSRDAGQTFQALHLHPWNIGACPMSTVSLASSRGRVLLAWETAQQIYFASLDARTLKLSNPQRAPGEGTNRKHPSLAVAPNGSVLLAWTEGTGWKRGGSLAWQIFDHHLQPLGPLGSSPGLPPWDFGAAVATDDHFLIVS